MALLYGADLLVDPCRFVPYPGQLSQTVPFAQYLIKERKSENVRVPLYLQMNTMLTFGRLVCSEKVLVRC